MLSWEGISPNDKRAPTEDLLQGLLPLEEVKGFELLDSWKWHAKAEKWTLKCRLTAFAENGERLGDSTDWYILVSDRYPWGFLKLYPAKVNGLTVTYPHQNLNREGKKELPWRTGDICLDTTVGALGIHGRDREPYGSVPARLRWHCERAIQWIAAAFGDSLAQQGDRLELPHIAPCYGPSYLVAFSEDRDSLGHWGQVADRVGDVSLFAAGKDSSSFVVDSFHRLGEGTLLRSHWGRRFREISIDRSNGIWMRLDEVPVLKPWKIPETWGELRATFTAQGYNFDSLLRSAVTQLRDGKNHLLLVGFPIAERIGEEPCCMHWLAIELPVLSHDDQFLKAFRANERGWWNRDVRQVISRNERIRYVKTQNWHQEQLSTRGCLGHSLASAKVAVIGCGALGAPLSELLLRSGVHRLTLIDGDLVDAGNLVRHVLTLDDVNAKKADALTERLNALSPHANVQSIPEFLPFLDEKHGEQLLECDVIVNCSASADVLRDLELLAWPSEKLFVVLSVSFAAGRLFCYSSCGSVFPRRDYHAALNPWLDQEQAMFDPEDLPREGIGCYHPVFPARCDDMWLWASMAMRLIEQARARPLIEPELHVYEQSMDERDLPVVRYVEKAVVNA